MSPFNKFEAIGIFVSVAVMAVALSVIRFNTDTFAITTPSTDSQLGSVVKTVSRESDTKDITERVTESVAADGTLRDMVIEDVKVGTGKLVANGDTVVVHYKGTLRDGTQFDNSRVRGEPFSFEVGKGKVIPGWEKGIIGMQVGGERILVIPPTLAYGNAQVGPIPPNSPLTFLIELLSIE